MRRKLPLSFLTVGRCFAHDPNESDGFEEPGSTGAAMARTVMAPASVWRVVQPGDSEVQCINALGAEQLFAAGLYVGEVPRGGFDRLVERVADPDDELGG